MTQEDKSRAYDKAIKRIKDLTSRCKNNRDRRTMVYRVEDIESIFPELKESDDEKIRKELIDIVEKSPITFAFENKGKVLAWLEKQRTSKFEQNVQQGDNIINQIERAAKEVTKSKENAEDFLKSAKIMDENGELAEEYRLEKQDEQKPSYTVEPKFKVGDWVVFMNNHQSIYQVEKIEDGYYILRHIYGGTFRVCILHDEDLRLWTIQDAKDGDVLATKKGNPFIYDKNRYNNGLAYYYVGLGVNKELTLKSPHHMLSHFGELHSVFPATKEQRDLLFQKIKEAGYKWDAKKKELKPIFDIEIPYGAKDSELQEVCYNIPEGFHAEIEGNKVIIKKGEQKSNWSEEDEKIYSRIYNLIHEAAFANCDVDEDGKELGEYAKIINWFKSLRPRNTWKPSEEQINALDEVYKTHGANSACRRVLITLLNDLRKLMEG